MAVQARAGVTVPGLSVLVAGLLAAGGIMAPAGAVLVALAVRQAMHRPPTAGADATWMPPAPRGPVGSDAADPAVAPTSGSDR
jgi:hypothetical protein